MSRKSRKPPAPDVALPAELDEQILRLREMLVLMAPETGSYALGASFPGYGDRLRQSQIYLTSPDPASF